MIKNFTRLLPALIILWCVSACVPNNTTADATTNGSIDDSTLFARYLFLGDSVYSTGVGYQTFSQSLKYFDSATAIADRSNDTIYLAEAAYAKGRVYDAWWREPRQTLHYYSLAAKYFKSQPHAYRRYMHQRYLTVHTYTKMGDTANAVKELQGMYTELMQKRADTAELRKMRFISELALISVNLGNYRLATDILANLRPRAWIENAPNSMDHLNHYILTQAILDAEYRNVTRSYYLDTLEQISNNSKKIMDVIFYVPQLARIYAARGDYSKAYKAEQLFRILADSLNRHQDVSTMQTALLQSDLDAANRQAQYEAGMRRRRQQIIWTLGISLGVISIMSVYLLKQSRKYKSQSKRLADVNKQLDDKVDQVELLNKEIQHRIKNNLHMIYSLLQMQERKTEDEHTIEQLQTARLRVESIASLHNQLMYHTGDLDFATFIRELIASVLSCLADDIKVVTHMNTEPVKLATNHYFALSLILNEWVTNSIKYAAKDGEVLEINVQIQNRNSEVCIEYWDNGTKTITNQTPKTGLGSQIVNLLSRQMSAPVLTLNGNPFHYQICVPHEPEN